MLFWIPLLALVGLADASYLLYKKLRHEHLTCLIGDDCERVTKSKYGSMFGIPNEVFGIGYYLAVLIGFFLLALGVKDVLSIPVLFTLQLVTVPAIMSSAYLLAIQAFVLKEWCEYCLLSAAVNGLLALFLFF